MNQSNKDFESLCHECGKSNPMVSIDKGIKLCLICAIKERYDIFKKLINQSEESIK